LARAWNSADRLDMVVSVDRMRQNARVTGLNLLYVYVNVNHTALEEFVESTSPMAEGIRP
jgi:hypothetical protein